MWNLQWSKWLFVLIWLFVFIAVFQIGFNIIKDRENKIKPICITAVTEIIWTIFTYCLYKVIEIKLDVVFNILNRVLNYILNLIPSWIWLWFLIPSAIAYLIFSIKGIYKYVSKAIAFNKATKETTKEIKKLTQQEMKKLDELSAENEAETVMLFNKLIFKAKRNDDLYVVKNGDNYWIPLWNDLQLKTIKKYSAKLTSNLNNIEYPKIIKLSSDKADLFDKKDGINEFRKELEGGK